MPNDSTRLELYPRETAGVVVGFFVGANDAGELLVDYPGNPFPGAIPARTTVPLTEQEKGRDATLIFENGDPARPIIVGLLQPPSAKPQRISAEVDDETLTLTAERQVVLRCGDASITLTRSGKVLIRGKYIVSRSTGGNLIKGGYIRLN